MRRQSETWFDRQASNFERRNAGSAPANLRVGTNGGGDREPRESDSKGNDFFIVGKTPIGGEEVVG